MSTKYVSFIEGLKSALPAVSSESRIVGAFYVTTDTNEIFVSENGGYNKISDVVIVETENQLPLAGTQKSNKIYYVSDTNSLYTVKTGTSGPEWVRSGEDTFAEVDSNGAVALANALYLANDVGSSTKGVYFDDGVPVEMTYSLHKDVPSDAVFTDTTYSEGTGIAITNGNVVKAKIKSETASTLTAASKGSTANREYAVGVDADGNLSVNVPCTDIRKRSILSLSVASLPIIAVSASPRIPTVMTFSNLPLLLRPSSQNLVIPFSFVRKFQASPYIEPLPRRYLYSSPCLRQGS